MNCRDYRELLALRLYDELDAPETDRLQAHLEACAACRAYAAELDLGLGRLAREAPDDLPAGWAEQLRSRVANDPARRRSRAWRTWIGVAAGFVLGLGCSSWWRDAGEQAPATDAPTGRVAAVGGETGFRRATPPPLALSGGDLDRLQTWLRH